MAPDMLRNRITTWGFLGLVMLTAVITIKMLQSYLIAMTMGLILALLTAPLHRYLVRKKFKPSIAALITTVALALGIIGPAMTFSGMAAKQGINFGHWLSENEAIDLESSFNWVNNHLPESIRFELNEDLRNQVKATLGTFGKGATTFLLGIAKQIPEALMQIFIIVLTCYFVLADGRSLFAWFSKNIPIANELRQTLAGAFQNTAISVVWATMAAAGTQAAMMFLAFVSLQVPAAFLAGGCTFIFAFIPVLGSLPVWISGCIYLYLQGSFIKVVILAVIGVLTGFADNIVRPLVLKGRSEMHPFISFIAIFGGMQMFGFFGVFLGPIVAAILISLLQVWPKIFYPNNPEAAQTLD